MARIRSIKPDFWTDEKVVELSAFARLLFIGLWNFADDDGRMVYSPKKIKMQILPADSLDISELFGEIRRESMIDIYTIDCVEYLQICSFAKHQKIDKRTPSKLPDNLKVPPNPPEFPRIPTTDMEGKGREGIDIPPSAPVPKKRKSQKTQISDSFTISEAVQAWSDVNGHSRLNERLMHFANICKAKGYEYADWDAAFRNAITDDWAKLGKSPVAPNKPLNLDEFMKAHS